uniref:Uncharacterized protein n=1 Tax=Chrysemys picta bellii TaxID=8478 RepID=A0A8C3P912_CHRPI
MNSPKTVFSDSSDFIRVPRSHPPKGTVMLLRLCPSLLIPQLERTGISTTNHYCCVSPHLSPDGSGCKLCPMDWLSRRGKCYWFSKDSKNWKESCDDCSAKSSRKLVIQDQEEMVKGSLNIHNNTWQLAGLWIFQADIDNDNNNTFRWRRSIVLNVHDHSVWLCSRSLRESQDDY